MTKKINTNHIMPITLKKLLNDNPTEIPGIYYGYIDMHGYIALKHYNKKSYQIVLDSDMPLIIRPFNAAGAVDAMTRIKSIIELALKNEQNKWEDRIKL